VPLAIATGSGAIARRVMGSGVIGGMLTASFIAIFVVPASFYLFEKLVHRGDPIQGSAAARPQKPGENAKKGDPHA